MGFVLMVRLGGFFTERVPAFFGTYGASAQCYGILENLRVLPVVIAPFELCDVERQILGTDMMEAAHDGGAGVAMPADAHVCIIGLSNHDNKGGGYQIK
jgi:hypothetical protein